MEVYVWGAWLKWIFAALLLVLFVWAVIAVKRATVGKREVFYKRLRRWMAPKRGA